MLGVIRSHLHHGKTAFMDLLVRQTHLKEWDPAKDVMCVQRVDDKSQRWYTAAVAGTPTRAWTSTSAA